MSIKQEITFQFNVSAAQPISQRTLQYTLYFILSQSSTNKSNIIGISFTAPYPNRRICTPLRLFLGVDGLFRQKAITFPSYMGDTRLVPEILGSSPGTQTSSHVTKPQLLTFKQRVYLICVSLQISGYHQLMTHTRFANITDFPLGLVENLVIYIQSTKQDFFFEAFHPR